MDWFVSLSMASVAVPSFELFYTRQITQKSKETDTLDKAYTDRGHLECSTCVFAILESVFALGV